MKRQSELSVFLFLYLIILKIFTRFDVLAAIKRCVYRKIPEEFGPLILQDGFRFVHMPFGRWSNLNFLHNSRWITFFIQSCLVLYSFCLCAALVFISLMISSISLHNLYSLFCCVLSIFWVIICLSFRFPPWLFFRV